jgi:hypothetical protein
MHFSDLRGRVAFGYQVLANRKKEKYDNRLTFRFAPIIVGA